MYKGERMVAADAAKASGISVATIYQRIKNKWPEDRLFDPPRRSRISNPRPPWGALS
jgi:hypothetical protein